MNTNRFFTAVASFLFLAMPALNVCASPRTLTNTGKDYVVGVSRLADWSCGIYYEMRERDVTIRNAPWDQSLSTGALGIHVGYDLSRWLTVYGIVGSTDTELEGDLLRGFDSETDTPRAEYGIGCHLRLLDQEILDPALYEDRLRINVDIQYTENDAKYLAWEEVIGSATVSLVNDIHGFKNYVPNAITLFAGPTFSDLRGDIDESENVGFVVGSDIFLTRKVSIYVQMISWGGKNSSTTGFGANVIF